MNSRKDLEKIGRQADTVDLGGFLSILARYRWSIVFLTLAGLAAACAYLAVTNPAYTASGALFIDPRSRKIVTDEIIQGGFGTDASLVESQVSIIVSDGVLRRVVEKLNLSQDAEFVPPPQTGPWARIKELIRGPRQPAPPEITARESLARIVRVKRPARSYVLEVEATTGSAVKSAQIVDAVLEAYLADQTLAKSEEARTANALIDARLGELREAVRQAEARVDAFKTENRLVTSEGIAVSEQQLGRLNTEYATARSVAAEAKARFEQAESASRAGNPDSLPEAIRSGLVQRLREQFAQVARREAALSAQLGARHPVLVDIRSQKAELKSQIAAELKRIAASARAERDIAVAREREIAAAVEKAKKEVARTTTAQIKLRELEQELTTSRELLGAFLARAKETQEQIRLSAPEARIISKASIPTRPSFPPALLVLTLGTLVGLGAGITRALLGDTMDATINPNTSELTLRGRTPATTLPPIGGAGVLSGLRHRLGGRSSAQRSTALADVLETISGKSGTAGEAYRQAILRLLSAITARAAEKRPYVVALVSPETSAGVSTTALALAYTAATAGERVLLVDAASTDADLSSVFAAHIDEETVVVLDRKEDLARITTRDVASGLAFLPLALIDIRQLKAAQRRRLASGLAELAASYDWVFIDAGALLQDEAASALLPIADEHLLVARTGTTTLDRLHETERLLERLAERPISLVLTRQP